eukprot:10734897-Heterocapsa_arctica.AAC.2
MCPPPVVPGSGSWPRSCRVSRVRHVGRGCFGSRNCGRGRANPGAASVETLPDWPVASFVEEHAGRAGPLVAKSLGHAPNDANLVASAAVA